jgi:hypothetical protein
MDPFTLAVSVAGLTSLAKDVCDVVWTVYLEDVIHAHQDIRDFHTKLRALQEVLSSLKELLEDDAYEIKLKFAQDSGLEVARRDCEHALLDLKRKLPRPKQLKHKPGVNATEVVSDNWTPSSKLHLRHRLIWPFKSDDVKKTCRKLDEYCSVFQFCLSIEHCKMMARSSRTTIEELEQLRDQLQDLRVSEDEGSVISQIRLMLDILKKSNDQIDSISKGVNALITEADRESLAVRPNISYGLRRPSSHC